MTKFRTLVYDVWYLLKSEQRNFQTVFKADTICVTRVLKSNSDIGTFKICISLKFVVQAVRRKKRGKQKKNYQGDEEWVGRPKFLVSGVYDWVLSHYNVVVMSAQSGIPVKTADKCNFYCFTK